MLLITYVKCLTSVVVFFFFKQKTAYERRISDWSSDVCSSDLVVRAADSPAARRLKAPGVQERPGLSSWGMSSWAAWVARRRSEIGSASCRERVCKYV